MGEPANPTPSERAETRAIARAIVEAVRNDEAWPPGTAFFARTDGDRADFEVMQFRFAQEIGLLENELADRARDR